MVTSPRSQSKTPLLVRGPKLWATGPQQGWGRLSWVQPPGPSSGPDVLSYVRNVLREIAVAPNKNVLTEV